MSKLKKLLKNPMLFARDYLIKKFPVKVYELPVFQENERQIKGFCDFLEDKMQKNYSSKFPIDLVFTWAGTQNQALEFAEEFKSKKDIICDFAYDPARFSDHNELLFSVKSALKNVPWVRNIFIVANEIPAFISSLSEDEKNKIKIINHQQIIDAQYLPTFNSHAIEANLHKIPDLSENFVYLNDDCIITSQLNQAHFFQGNEIANLFVSDKSMEKELNKIKNNKSATKTATLWANENSLKLLQKQYPNSHFDSILIHSGKSLKKSAFNLAWSLWEKEIRDFLPNKFRSKNDLNLAAFLVPYLMYAENQAVIWTELCDYFDVATPVAKTHYTNLLNKAEAGFNPHSICLNSYKASNNLECQDNLKQFLKNYAETNNVI